MTKLTTRTLTNTALGAVFGLALAGHAFAQSSQSQPSQNHSSQGSSGSSAQSFSGQRTQAQVMSQDKLRQQLTQAGFREVQILDAAYLVQAQTQDGQTVMMMIDPPHGGSQTSRATSGSRTSGSSGGSGSAASGGSGNQSGSGQTR